VFDFSRAVPTRSLLDYWEKREAIYSSLSFLLLVCLESVIDEQRAVVFLLFAIFLFLAFAVGEASSTALSKSISSTTDSFSLDGFAYMFSNASVSS
jgi:hypothetical protein